MPPRKKTRTIREFGAPTKDDSSNARARFNQPSTVAYSYRKAPGKRSQPRSLTQDCIRVFAANLDVYFATGEGVGWNSTSVEEREKILTVRRKTRRLLKTLPDHLLESVFAVLKTTHPTKLTSQFITEYFLRGATVTLDGSVLAGINKKTVTYLQRLKGNGIRELELSELPDIPDDLFAECVSAHASSLEKLVLRHSTKAGPKTADAIARCPRLRVINVGHTSTPPVALASFILRCPELQVLKAASLRNFRHPELKKIVDIIYPTPSPEDEGIGSRAGSPLFPNIRTIKLRMNTIYELYLPLFLGFFPHLSNIDLSFTGCGGLPKSLPFDVDTALPLEKLNLTSTAVPLADVIAVISGAPRIKKLRLGGLGGSLLHSGGAMIFSDHELLQLNRVLNDKCPEIEEVSLVGNTKLGNRAGPAHSSRALMDFVRTVGRRCKILNLSNTAIRSSDLVGLLPGPLPNEFPGELEMPTLIPEGPPALEALRINNTKIDDEASHYLASCSALEILEVEGTRFSERGLFRIIDSCELLKTLDLTSCRGVRPADRRTFFQVWEAQQGGR